MDLNVCGKQPSGQSTVVAPLTTYPERGYPILNGSCLHLGSEHPGWFHTQREQSCPGKKLGDKYAYYGVNTSKHRAGAGVCMLPTLADRPGRRCRSHMTGGKAPATE
jgi:hypothetical protein